MIRHIDRVAGATFALLFFSLSATAQVFVNELHYDNTGTDTGEAIELAGPAGTDLSGWSIVLYNGSNGSVYNTNNLSGTIADQQGGLGTIAFTYPTNGIQNGSPDGIALVDGGSNVVQFLSYEGAFTAVGGPADGMMSTDIGVSEASGTAIGDSLQLTGSGSFYTDFTWAGAQPNTFGAVNTGQTFGGGQPPEPILVINEIDYDQPGSDAAEFIELFNAGGIPVELSGYSLELVNGSTTAVYNTIVLPAFSLGAGQYFVVCANAATTANCNLDASPNTNLIQNGAPDAVALLLGASIVDTVSYEGDTAAPYTEGSGAGLVDSAAVDFLGISRFPDGADTDQNNVDLSPRCITPGDANSADSTACPDPLAGPPVVINEIHADPASGLGGDANNDGVRDASEDEFVEVVNNSGAPLDISGWTLSDGFGLRHTFPAGSVLADQCGVVLFGGGAPTGGFGGATVQTASSGSLGLNNSGDTITLNDGGGDVVSVSYGSEGGNNQSLSLDPDVTGTPPYAQHTLATGSGGALFSPGTRVDGSLFDGCEAPTLGPFEIFEIQGDGPASPFVGQTVITLDNTVTTLAPNGFFMQTPTARSDNNVDTSDGIFVFTGGAPGVATGDAVDVTGDVVEFFGFTEISNSPDVTIQNSGLPLPAPVAFDGMTPSPDPTNPSCAIEFECYEAMLVEVADGAVTGPNQRFSSDTIAEVHITAAAARTFRETGIEFPGMAGLPVWDGNPEVFELDPDKLGLPNQIIPAGSGFSATGVLGFEFGGYELWPSSLMINEAVLPQAVRAREKREITVGSLNLFRLFDDVDDPPTTNSLGETINDQVVSSDEYQRRLAKFAAYIIENMDMPDILGVQEAEKLGVLEDLADLLNSIDKKAKYEAYLEEGNDIGSIDVGFLVRRTRANVRSITQLGADETFIDPSSGQPDLLHDRPPLVLEARARGNLRLNVMVVHNRSLGGITTERVQVKRFEQAQSIAQMVQDLQTTDSRAGLVVVGDFNAFEFTDGFVDSVGHIRGSFDPTESLLSGVDLVEPDLMNQVLSLPENERYSFIFRGNAQTLDHALTSQPLDLRVRGLEYARGNADAAVDLINDDATTLRSSDHDGLVLFIFAGEIDDDDDDSDSDSDSDSD